MLNAEQNLGQFITRQLDQNGYILLPAWRREENAISIARMIGTVVQLRSVFPHSNLPTVQILKPKNKIESLSSRYSGTYGLAEFPFHTDLAHWLRPPRYLLLRCYKGSKAVTTRLLIQSTIGSMLGMNTLKRALVRPRRSGSNGSLCLLPLLFFENNTYGIRWDSLFLVPMNKLADQVADIISTITNDATKFASLTLVNCGDTLIIDNWRCLHSRSKVSMIDLNRRIERVYLSDIYT